MKSMKFDMWVCWYSDIWNFGDFYAFPSGMLLVLIGEYDNSKNGEYDNSKCTNLEQTLVVIVHQVD